MDATAQPTFTLVYTRKPELTAAGMAAYELAPARCTGLHDANAEVNGRTPRKGKKTGKGNLFVQRAAPGGVVVNDPIRSNIYVPATVTAAEIHRAGGAGGDTFTLVGAATAAAGGAIGATINLSLLRAEYCAAGNVDGLAAVLAEMMPGSCRKANGEPNATAVKLARAEIAGAAAKKGA